MGQLLKGQQGEAIPTPRPEGAKGEVVCLEPGEGEASAGAVITLGCSFIQTLGAYQQESW